MINCFVVVFHNCYNTEKGNGERGLMWLGKFFGCYEIYNINALKLNQIKSPFGSAEY